MEGQNFFGGALSDSKEGAACRHTEAQKWIHTRKSHQVSPRLISAVGYIHTLVINILPALWASGFLAFIFSPAHAFDSSRPGTRTFFSFLTSRGTRRRAKRLGEACLIDSRIFIEPFCIVDHRHRNNYCAVPTPLRAAGPAQQTGAVYCSQASPNCFL